jgi:cytochrome P450
MSPEPAADRAYFLGIPERRQETHDDILNDLVTARQQNLITEDELLSFVWMFFSAGYDMGTTLVNMIALLDEFGLLDTARAHLDNPEWIRSAMEETLRFMPPFSQEPTFAVQEVELPSGAVIPPHSQVVACYAAANRDPAVFERPHEFDPVRRPNPHFGFGRGPHYCTGANLARVVIPAAVTGILRTLPGLRLEPGSFRRYPRVTDYVEARAVHDGPQQDGEARQSGRP